MNTQVNLAGIIMKNPVMTASGTVGFGEEFNEWCDINQLGAFVPKSITLQPRKGNPTGKIAQRVWETPSGMLNSIGLVNPGVDCFLEEILHSYYQYKTQIIMNISATNLNDFVELTKRISKHPHSDAIAGLEVNLSCPNDRQGKMVFSTDYDATYEVTKAVKQETDKPVIVKLTPNVTDIRRPAEAVYDAGGDALSMINTVRAMAIDIETREPRIHGGGTYIGGLSGPAIKPIGIANVYLVHKSGNPLPIIGIGGIMTGSDAIEYIIAGATAVGIGTANFPNPRACTDIIKGIKKYMTKNKIQNINDLRGSLKEPK